MAEVYLYVPAGRAGYAVDCGIKLSEWYNREVYIEGDLQKCITALLNPRDEYDKYISNDYRCLKLEVKSKYCYVADRLLYEAGLSYPEVMEMYGRSIVPIDKYVFGDYRTPEVLITTTILGEYINVTGRMLDSPVLYENSRELYFNDLMERMREEHGDLNDILLYLYFRWLCEAGRAECMGEASDGAAVFVHKGDNRTYTFKIPGRI